jgi:L-lactate dehydrogenase complex protein LldF
VLPWAGGGSRTTAYITAITGPRRAVDEDGPQELYVVIVDNGRSHILGTEYQSILHCIRCGACLDVCPVYRKIGGHAYDVVYPGPIGAVLSPLIDGLKRHPELPHLCSLCGACSEVCSAQIPLAGHLLRLRSDAVRGGLESSAWGLGFRCFAEVTARPRLWAAAERAARLLLRLFERGGAVHRGPGLLGKWTRSRDFPALAPRSFRESWRGRGAAEK